MMGLDNHGSWFGEPDNQIGIIKALQSEGISNLGIVFNQHHGNVHIEGFNSLLQRMLPNVLCLNLSALPW